MKVLGVTGGSGCGKTTVCKILKDNGAEILDADAIVKKLQRKGTKTFKKIVAHFGESIVDELTGELNRKALAEIVFNDAKERAVLNGIVHTEVAKVFKKKIAEFEKAGVKLTVLDVPIPTEEGFYDLVNAVWAVVANDDLRIERIMERSGFTQDEALARISAQHSNREYSEIADTVIDNEGSYEELEKLVEFELERLMNDF